MQLESIFNITSFNVERERRKVKETEKKKERDASLVCKRSKNGHNNKRD
jgi:hypothetical protein